MCHVPACLREIHQTMMSLCVPHPGAHTHTRIHIYEETPVVKLLENVFCDAKMYSDIRG